MNRIEEKPSDNFILLNSLDIPTISGNPLDCMLVYHPFIDITKRRIGYENGTFRIAYKIFENNIPFSTYSHKEETYNYNQKRIRYYLVKGNMIFDPLTYPDSIKIIDYSSPKWNNTTGHYVYHAICERVYYDYWKGSKDQQIEEYIQKQLKLFSECTGITEIADFFKLSYKERKELSEPDDWRKQVVFDYKITIPEKITDRPGMKWTIGDEYVNAGPG